MSKSPQKQPTDAPGLPWWEKTRRIIQDMRRSYGEIEAGADWPRKTLKTALSQKSNITIRKAIGLARALGVTADWLFDPAQPWEALPQAPDPAPPPEPQDSLSQLCRAVALAYKACKVFAADVEAEIAERRNR